MKYLKIVLNIIVAVTVVFTSLELFLNYICPYETENEIVAEYEKDNDLLNEIVQTIINSNVDSIHIYDDGEKWTHEPEHIQGITDADIDRIISIAKRRKYSIVEKTDSYIYFQLWANLDSSRGLIYSLIEEKPQKQYLTRIISLSQKNWYYYETDINEYRRMRERGEVKD